MQTDLKAHLKQTLYLATIILSVSACPWAEAAGEDSTAITPTTLAVPSMAASPLQMCPKAANLTDNNLGCTITLQSQTDTAASCNSASPCQLKALNDAATSVSFVPLVYSGTYYVGVTLTLTQKSTLPVYVWVADWAATYDYNNDNLIQNRVFYSGDSGFLLNPGSGNYVNVYYSGVVHLNFNTSNDTTENSLVNLPQVWFFDPAPSGSLDSTTVSGTMYISLLSFP